MARRKRRSRLARYENRKIMWQSVGLLVMAIVIVILLAVWGIPLMVRMAGFWGDLRLSSQPIVSDDDIAPFAPQIALDYEATSSARIDVSGYAEASSTVLLFRNGSKVAEVVVDDEGEFRFLNVKLLFGENDFTAQAMDSAGNESQTSKIRSVLFDDETPELTVTSPDIDSGEVRTENRSMDVEGQTEEGARVYVNNRLARMSSGGVFKSQIGLSDGDNTIEIRAVDRAGNSSRLEFKVTYYQ